MKYFTGFVFGLFNGEKSLSSYDSIFFGPCESKDAFDEHMKKEFYKEFDGTDFLSVTAESMEVMEIKQ